MRISRLLCMAMVGLAGVAAAAAPQGQVAGLGVYEDINYRGGSATFLSDAPDLRPSGLEYRISSLRVGPGEVWQACTERNYQGRCQVFDGDTSDLRRSGWNDAIASVRRLRGGAGPGRDGNGPVTRGLTLFAGTRFSGQRTVLMQAESNLRRVNFNDRASSVIVPPGETWELCVNADYDDCRVVDGDVPDLGVIGLSRELSSARPRPFGRRGGSGGGLLPAARLVLYDETNYRGRTTVIDEDTPSLRWQSNTAGSLRVMGGRWEVCDDTRYQGQCVIVASDVPDLARLRLRDRISSVRLR